MRHFKTICIFWGMILVLMFISSCTNPEKEMQADFFLKTPQRIMTCKEFSEELELKKAAYPYTIGKNSAEYNEMVIDLVKMLSQEIVLLSAAQVKGVVVSDQELQAAEAEFRKDYPEDSFDQMLLETAISYPFWKKRFKNSMIIDKLVDQELKNTVQISVQDIVSFYDQYPEKAAAEAAASEKGKISEAELIAGLRLQKAQDSYDQWLEQLEKDYPLELNKEKLKSVLLDIE